MKIIFMGTPEFASHSLSHLLSKGHNIVAVVTTPIKPAGRGQKERKCAVMEVAEFHNIPILSPFQLKDPDFKSELEAFDADLFVVVAFKILPKTILEIPKKGSINLHASLLPDYRGAAPINHAIMNGETETGNSVFFIKPKVDTGDIILQEKIAIHSEDNVGILHDKLMINGAELLNKAVNLITENKQNSLPQDHLQSPKKAPKIFKEDCKIEFDLNLLQAHNKVRGLSPYPVAWLDFYGKKLKIYQSKKLENSTNHEIGTILSNKKDFLALQLQDGILQLTDIQMEGKKRMSVNDFLKGFHFPSEPTFFEENKDEDNG